MYKPTVRLSTCPAEPPRHFFNQGGQGGSAKIVVFRELVLQVAVVRLLLANKPFGFPPPESDGEAA